MAVYHCSIKPLSRSDGRSAVAAAAYRSGECLTNDRDGVTHDYTNRGGIVHTEIVLPDGVDSTVAANRSTLWNAAEAAEKRKDARTAREVIIALPHELTPEQRLELTQAFAHSMADRYGVAIDVAIHAPGERGDERNHHAHLLMTTRQIEADGFGDKSMLEWQNKQLLGQGLPTTDEQVRMVRSEWADLANEALVRASHDVRIDARSHQDRGLDILPTEHVGVHATAIERSGGQPDRQRISRISSGENAEKVRARPAAVLDVITSEKSVFDQHDIARTLHRYIDDPTAYQTAFAKVLASNDLMKLQDEQRGEDGRVIPARYTTKTMFLLEHDMAAQADQMAQAKGFGVDADEAIRRFEAKKGFTLKEEQTVAVRHITGDAQIASVSGMAGAGKSTMLGAANLAWTAGGHRVFGAALGGKATEGLEESSGIASRTLAKWEHQWKQGKDTLQQGDVLVIDEAGMVGSEQLARFVKTTYQAGAKLVLVGDAEQLQAINAGAAFRAVSDRIGCVDLELVTRQKEQWMRDASVAFGQKRTAEGLAAYAEHGAVQMVENRDATIDAIVRDAVEDAVSRRGGSRIVLAHRNDDVRDLNAGIRTGLKQRGRLQDEATFQTDQGDRQFADGDRLVFLENNRRLGVKNGTLGTVLTAQAGSLMVRLDGRGGVAQIARQYVGQAVNKMTGKAIIDTSKPVIVTINSARYNKVDHGYATTIHKSQGATVDRAFVLASVSMDRHLTYVSMTRHKAAVTLYADKGEFRDLKTLTAQLSRSNAKETTLDYTLRRGLAPSSQIMVPETLERETAPIALQQTAAAVLRRDSGGDRFKAAAQAARDRRGSADQPQTVAEPPRRPGRDRFKEAAQAAQERQKAAAKPPRVPEVPRDTLRPEPHLPRTNARQITERKEEQGARDEQGQSQDLGR